MTLVVLVHGFTGGPASWDGVERSLSPARVIKPTLRGHAGHPDGEWSWDDELDGLERALPDQPHHLVGYSLGARLALGLLARGTSRASRATLIGARLGITTEHERRERRVRDSAWIDLLRREGIAEFARAWDAQPLFRSQARLPGPARAAQDALRRGHSAEGLAGSLGAVGLAHMPDLVSRLHSIAIPVTLLCGGDDEAFVAHARALEARLPRAQLRVAPGAGHNLVLERPSLVAATIESEPAAARAATAGASRA